MVTGFEAFGAIVGAIGLLNLARQGCECLANNSKNYRQVGSHFLDIQRECDNLFFILDKWHKFWGLDTFSNEKYCQGYWGEDGWRRIREQLVALNAKCEDLALLVDKSLSSIPKLEAMPEDARIRAQARLDKHLSKRGTRGTWSVRLSTIFKQSSYHEIKGCKEVDLVKQLRFLEEYAAMRTSRLKKAKHVLWASKPLLERIEAVQKAFTGLEAIVKAAWSDIHPFDSTTLTPNQRRLIALTGEHRTTLEEAQKDRTSTEALYRCCSETKKALKLEMKIIQEDGDAQCKKFQILEPHSNGNVHQEIITELGQGNPVPKGTKFRNNFLEACEKAQIEGHSFLYTHGGSSEKIRLWFTLHRCSRPAQAGRITISTIRIVVKSMVIAERLDLAFKVVESGLILFGTSWVSALSSNSLKRYKDSEREPRYVLDINVNDEPVTVRLSEDDFQKEKMHQYVFAIGALLVELALQKTVKDAERRSDGHVLVIEDLPDSRMLSTRGIMREIEVEIGKAYAEAVQFCLQDPLTASNRNWEQGVIYDTTQSEEEISLVLLELFFKEVVLK